MPRQATRITEYEVGDELVLYDPRNDYAHILNGTAAVVWWLCDGEHTEDQIAGELAAAYDLAPSRVIDDVRNTLETFRKAGLVTMGPG
jgi:PqqD family protein of HPr-rel-A system